MAGNARGPSAISAGVSEVPTALPASGALIAAASCGPRHFGDPGLSLSSP